MSSLRVGSRTGGHQAPRREALLALRYGRAEAAATAVAILFAAASAYLVGSLGLTSSEALVRTARLGTLWNGYDTSLVAFGFDRPPLLSVLGLPFAASERLREHGLASALGTATGSAVSVLVASGLARRAGFSAPATVLFVAAFALNPLLVFAGVVGLPEAIYATLVLAAIAEFGVWLERQDVAGVIVAGVALGVAFLLRYNVALVVAAMAWGFWSVTRARHAGERESEAAQATMLAFLVPAAFIVGLWTLLSLFPRGDLFWFLDLARRATALADDHPDVLRRMGDLRGSPLATLAWVGGWTALLAPASVVAVAALSVRAAGRRSRRDAALAVVCASVVLPEAVALVTGFGQARVPHLFVAVAPAFAVLALRERSITRGVRPARHERRRRRAQLAWTAGLFVVSMATAAVFPLLPEADRPATALVALVEAGEAPEPPADAVAAATFLRENAGPGDVLVDVERHAEVMLLTGGMWRFQTDADHGEEATLYEPFGLAEYVLVRRPLPGQGPGRIERAYPGVFDGGAVSLSLAFDAGEYRIYAVTGPAIP